MTNVCFAIVSDHRINTKQYDSHFRVIKSFSLSSVALLSTDGAILTSVLWPLLTITAECNVVLVSG